MANVRPEGTILIDLQPRDVNRLVIKPGLNYDNVLTASPLNVYELIGGVKNKVKMTQLNTPQFTLKPKESCAQWNPTVRMGARADEIRVEDYELEGEMCADEFDTNCMRNLRGDGVQMVELDGSEQLSAIEMAMASLTRESLTNSMAQIAHFSDPLFGSDQYLHAEAMDFDSMDVDDSKRAKTMLSKGYGYWAEIQERYASGQIREVLNTNDGTTAGNTTKANGAYELLNRMYEVAPPLLKNWNQAAVNQPKPIYLVQSGIFRGYKNYLRALGTEMAHRFILDGEIVPGVLEFDGFAVVNVPEWDMFDYLMGAMDPNTGLSKIQRALFTAPRNLTIAYNAVGGDGMNGSSMIVQRSPVVRDKGKVYTYSAVALGAGIANDNLIVPAYNTNYGWA